MAVTSRGRDRYSLLLGLLVVSYLLSAARGGRAVAVGRLVAFVAVLVLALHTSQTPRRLFRALTAISVLGTVCTSALSLARHGSASQGALHLWTFLVLSITVEVIVARVLSHPVVSLQTILGAISAYLVIGMAFAALYAALATLSGRPFFAQSRAADLPLYQYFSFTTLTTLGYGDFTPETSLGRAVAVLEALLGQVFLVTLVARLVSAFTPGRSGRPGRSGHPRSEAGPGPGEQDEGGDDRELPMICTFDPVCLTRCG